MSRLRTAPYRRDSSFIAGDEGVGSLVPDHLAWARSNRLVLGVGAGLAALFLILSLSSSSSSKPAPVEKRVNAAGVSPQPSANHASITDVKPAQPTSMLQILKEGAKHDKKRHKKR